MSENRVAIITGASSGLGAAILEAVSPHYNTIIDWSIDVDNPVNICDERSVMLAVRHLWDGGIRNIDTVINCAGVNHIEFLPDLKIEDWDRVMNTNARGMFLVAKHTIEMLRGGTMLNIVSNASHMPMTSSAAYNASKGAAEILTRQMSRELIKTHGITVFGISPNKLKNTGMSEYIDNKVCELRGWTPEEARNYQIASLPAGVETDPETLAEFIAFLLSTKERHRYLAGTVIPYGL